MDVIWIVVDLVSLFSDYIHSMQHVEGIVDSSLNIFEIHFLTAKLRGGNALHR